MKKKSDKADVKVLQDRIVELEGALEKDIFRFKAIRRVHPLQFSTIPGGTPGIQKALLKAQKLAKDRLVELGAEDDAQVSGN